MIPVRLNRLSYKQSGVGERWLGRPVGRFALGTFVFTSLTLALIRVMSRGIMLTDMSLVWEI